MNDLRRALRAIRRAPGVSFVAALSLALGIGANTAIFSVINGLLLRTIAVREPGRLIRLASVDAQGRAGYLSSTLVDLIAREQLVDGTCMFLTPLATTEVNGRRRELSTVALSGDCFETLGVRPTLGRLFSAADDHESAAGVVVLTYDTWQAEFAGQPDVLGRPVNVDGRTLTVIGVTERGFRGVLVGFPARLLYPLRPSLAGSIKQPVYAASVFARVGRDRSVAQVTERLRARWPELLEASVPPAYRGGQREAYLARQLAVLPASTGIDYSLRARFERPLLALLAIAVLVLLVSSVNVANLLLARATERWREYSVHMALGAGPGRLARAILLESGLLIAPGLALGVLSAPVGAAFLTSLYGSRSDNFALDVTPDARILLFAVATAVVAFACSAIGPLSKVRRVDPSAALNAASMRIAGDRRTLQRVLVAVQVAITFVLVAGATVFAQTLAELRGIRVGFDAQRTLTARHSPLPGVTPMSFRRDRTIATFLTACRHPAFGLLRSPTSRRLRCPRRSKRSPSQAQSAQTCWRRSFA